MTYSEIKITFNSSATWGTVVKFDISNGLNTFDILEEFVLLRYSGNQAVAETSLLTTSAINYREAFNLDYNSTNSYEVTVNSNQVTIKSKDPSITFSNGSAINYPPLGGSPTSKDISFAYNNFQGNIFNIDEVVFEEALNPCSYVKLKVTTSELSTKIKSPVILNGNTENPFYINILRSGGILPRQIILEVENDNNQIVQQKLVVPNTLSVENVSINVNPSPNGGTVIISVSNSTGLDLEYSLNNVDFTTSNVFDSLTSGNYAIYIKDQLGCSVSKSFTISDFSASEPHFYISPTNSFRFVHTKKGGINTNNKLDRNKFSYQDDVYIPYKGNQLFKKTDIIQTQFESNYESISAKTIDKDSNETNLIVNKLTTNRSIKESRDAIKFNFGNGKTGVYFTTGKKYNYDTGIDLNEDYTLNGYLPEWGVVGNFIKVDTSWLKIEDIIYDEIRFAKVLIVGISSTTEETIKVSTIYNRENYDVYEFSTIMSTFLNKEISIEIKNEDSNFDDLIHESKFIKTFENFTTLKEVVYKNDTNTDILFSTGIEFKMWVKTEKVYYKPIGESENHKTDTNVVLLNGNVRKSKVFQFDSLTSEKMIQLYLALFHRVLFIDSQRYVLENTPEVEEPEGDTNLYKITATLISVDESYDSKSYNNSIPITGNSFEVPSLIEITSNGFIKI
tara:strand:- start:5104 stop:7131 length:2028 start_codon:yes stop_codon:yes gene_type:complete